MIKLGGTTDCCCNFFLDFVFDDILLPKNFDIQNAWTSHDIHADEPILHSYIHIQDHKHAHKNGNIHRLTSIKLSEIVESSV